MSGDQHIPANLPEPDRVLFAALQSNLGLPTCVDLISRGMAGLRVPVEATMKECCDHIIKAYVTRELDGRLREHSLLTTDH